MRLFQYFKSATTIFLLAPIRALFWALHKKIISIYKSYKISKNEQKTCKEFHFLI